MNKDHIISEIVRTTEENNGKPLGTQRFERVTGIKKSDWYGKYWTKWGDALKEAGYKPNTFQKAYDPDILIRHAIDLIRELGCFYTYGDLRMKSHNDSAFPSHSTMGKLGKKYEAASKILEFCEGQEGFNDVADICRPICRRSQVYVLDDTDDGEEEFGFVYLIKSGRYYKIGRSISAEKRHYEINLLLPEKAKLIHKIKTDDPVGIEAYWHKRFEDKRARGEWFELSAKDVKVFRQRSFM